MEKLYDDRNIKLYSGDVFDLIDDLPSNMIQSIITSPTYWGKRRFTSDPREFGSESLENYVERNVKLYSKLLDKTKSNGSLFVIIQDTFMGSGVSRTHHNHWENNIDKSYRRDGIDSSKQGNTSAQTASHKVIKNKSLSGIPYRIAIKLIDMGYLWRQHIIWEKPNPMPENISDRLRQSAEYILHFTKNGKYKFNSEPFMIKGKNNKNRLMNQVIIGSTESKPGHTATFPSKIVKKLLLASTDEDDLVFEPFLGSGTMMDLCIEYNRKFIGCDINQDFIKSSINRIDDMRQKSNTKLLDF